MVEYVDWGGYFCTVLYIPQFAVVPLFKLTPVPAVVSLRRAFERTYTAAPLVVCDVVPTITLFGLLAALCPLIVPPVMLKVALSM
jgi:hypothetical protein